MSDTVLSVLANSSPLPIAIVAESGVLLVANRALRLLVDDEHLCDLGFGRDLSEGRRVIVRTRTGGALALEVIVVPDGTGSWILRGEDPARRHGLAEEAAGFMAEPAGGQMLGLQLRQAAQRAQEQDRSVALLILRPFGLGAPAPPANEDATDDTLALLDGFLIGKLRAADRLLPQDDGTRAIVAVVSGGDGAAALGSRLAGIFSQPIVLRGTRHPFGIHIGIAHADDADGIERLEGRAREALALAEDSCQPVLSITGPCPA
ncbi:MAG TPA: hypothetical protein VHL31_01840 [Geminicoccus sp.]|uniref:hypothetical protein n=1 Tax=Geminicoccus sp. TaxID=2024832 RepID=UPI002E3266CA|nr:hypothetical protein [Geminicoccus sp.]HEX2525028.1 hypothetical protein [Geminicoccus sp.]